MPVVLYGFESFSSALREYHALWLFRNMTLRKVTWNQKAVTEDWRKLDGKDLHGSYSSPDTTSIIRSRKITLAGHVARVEGKSIYNVFMGIPDGKKRLGDVEVYEMIILKWVVKHDWRA
jgi:hypothetical protein